MPYNNLRIILEANFGTNFLLNGKKLESQIENGKMMFIYQAQQAFNIWHKIMPNIDDKTIRLIE